MITSIDYAEIAGLKIALGHLTTLEPEQTTVIEWIRKRIKQLEDKKND